MRTFRIRVSVMAALLLAVGLAVSPAMGDAKWLESYDEAIKMARESGKPVMINFTGSDWCGWCIRLDREVFATSEFAKWSSDNVVLLKLDFPRRTPMPSNSSGGTVLIWNATAFVDFPRSSSSPPRVRPSGAPATSPADRSRGSPRPISNWKTGPGRPRSRPPATSSVRWLRPSPKGNPCLCWPTWARSGPRLSTS
ncbi:MAG: thioredoxin family protein [Phycisphaeraceae bacterium]|nr:thioredoxin family protein [Phycisphaeraceae bacterium]